MDQAPYQPAPTSSAKAAPAAVTPMMAQYFEIKAVNPGFLLFYRMGDFYELFFEDAEIASQALGIVLTKRGKHLENDIPMCGVPVHAAQDYLKKLIGLGHRVAICEQMENPAEAKKRGSKSVVKRDVVRLVTPGTLTEEDLLSPHANNFLAALAVIPHEEQSCALAWADISTGETWVQPLSQKVLADELGRINPAELIVADSTSQDIMQATIDLAHVISQPAAIFDSESARARLNEAFPSFAANQMSRVSTAALGALVDYIAQTQKQGPVYLRAPQIHADGGVLSIDVATRNSLELLATNRGEAAGSLRAAMDETITAAGSRLLARRLSSPLADPDAINARLNMVECCLADAILTNTLRQTLKAVPDLTRALTRLALERGGPRDLRAIGSGIAHARALGQCLEKADDLAEGLRELAQTLAGLPATLANELERAIIEEPPLLARDGGFVAKDYDSTLDKERALAADARTIVAQLQARLATETDIKALKIKHNNVLGYFIEVPSASGGKLTHEPHSETFIHRQTMANAMRFTTAELAELEGRIARAHDAALDIERNIFDNLRANVIETTDALRAAADALAVLDLTTALATLAAKQSYCRPLVDSSLAFEITQGRHPVVEKSLAISGETFVTNDCVLGTSENAAGDLWLVTGPNMGGKSTFLRQNALIAVMAQMGSFVPAKSAHIGIVDQVFSRVGASDDIAHGRSTFMVEMVETAAILNRATARSLVVLDEIGRGTATYDGLSIAWATAEALHETNQCRALFATHFHELTALSKKMDRVSNHTMKVREFNGEVVFLHEVSDGVADRSYGIQVARLAGLPEAVLARAGEVLSQLESLPSSGTAPMLDELPLFTHQPQPKPKQHDPLAALLDTIRPDELTPRAAIEIVYDLKKARDASRRD